MKRRREAEMVASEMRSAIEQLSQMEAHRRTTLDTSGSAGGVDCDQLTATAQVPIKPFLSLCNLLIQVLDKIGPTMAVLRLDIHQNIQRLEKFHDSDPSTYRDVVEILKKEVGDKAKQGPTCSKSFVWLTRSLDFTLALLEFIMKDSGRPMQQAVEESYNRTLKPWHGWISSAAYKVALKLLPDMQTFTSVLKANDQDCDMLKEEMQTMISLLIPVIQQNQDIMRTYGLDTLKAT
ncbi:glycolipid transfer protein 3-like isoform X1 [Primulina tabacum]|uniref:glycolipid transfer protein 3-like isoform X1 n=1 Tax=Primulina tabacum TaxID=48773 RepID=UPI003F5A87FE